MTTRAHGPLSGLLWLKRGFNAGRANPRAVFGGAAVLMVAALLPSVAQALAHLVLRPGPGAAAVIAALTTVLAVIVVAPLVGGYLRLIDACERGRPAHAAEILAPYRSPHDRQHMIGFAFATLVIQLFALSILTWLFGQVIQNLEAWTREVSTVLQQPPPGPDAQVRMPSPPDGLGGLFGLGSLFTIFVVGVFAIGMGQVALQARSVGEALRDGVVGALKNLLPLLVLAAAAFALMMAAGFAMVLVAAVLTLIHPLLAAAVFLLLQALFMLVLYAVMFSVMYQLWRDIAGTPAVAGIEV